MSTKVALLVINNKLPFSLLEGLLENLGYSCIILENYRTDIELPVFDVAIFGISSEKEWLTISNNIKIPNNSAVLYYSGVNSLSLKVDFPNLDSEYHISPNPTLRELELNIHLARLKKKMDLASIFSDSNPNSNHIRLKKILSEEQAWRILFEQSPNGVILEDEHGNILYANNAASDILGYTESELLKMKAHDLVSSNALEQVNSNIYKILNGESLTSEVFNIRKDGTKRYVQLHETRVIFPSGNYGIMVVSTDISRAKQAEEELRESLEVYKVLVERSNDGIIYASNEIITYGNPRICEMLKISEKDFVNKPLGSVLHENIRKEILDRYKKRLNGIKVPSIYETILLDAHGDSVHVEFNVNLTKLKGELITLVFIRDVTLRKQSEKALRESEESYRGLFNSASDGMYLLDPSGIILDVNPQGQKLIEMGKDELCGLPFEQLTSSELNDVEELRRKMRLTNQGHTQSIELTGETPSGKNFSIDVQLSRGFYFGLQIILAQCRDITDKKHAEFILRESEDKYRTLAEQIPIGIYRLSPDGEIIYCNETLINILGYKKTDEIIGQNVTKFTNKDITSWLLENSLSPGTEPIEQPIKKVNSKKIWVSNRLQPILNEHDEIVYYDGVLSDITDRKLAIDELSKSEERFREMIMTIPDRLFRISENEQIIDFAQCEHFFLPKIDNEIINKPLSSIFPKEICKKFSEAITLAKQYKKLQTFEIKYTYNTDEYFYEIRVLPSESGILLVLQRDITQQKKFESEVRMLAQTIMYANQSISITDLEGRFIYVNPAFTKIYGYSQPEILGKPTVILKPTNSDPKLDKEINEVTLKGGWNGELLNVRKDGSVFPISLSTATIFSEDGVPYATLGIANDISEQKRIEQELIRAKEKAEESDRLKTAFLSNMSHEIRSPMNAVLGFVQLLKSDEHLTEEGRQYIDLIQNSGHQLLLLIEDIIDISKIQSNQLRLKMETFDINKLMEELYLIFTNQLKLKDNCKTILLKPKLAQQTPFTIYSDPVRIRQILTNLLSNAVKFTPNGSIEFGYTIVIDDNSPLIKFHVIDTGIGISEDKQNLIFERFRQADDSYTRLYGGSGLGLAICKGLADLLGGNIWVESKVGEGSQFHFTIPFITGDSIGKGTETYSFNNEESVDKEDFKKKKILVIEDIKEIRLYFEKVLQPTGAKVMFASNGAQARKLFKSNKDIHLILMDIRLPDIDGYNLALEFKQMRPNVPIIAQTAYALQSEYEKSIESGCDDYITKPLDAHVLFKKIQKLLNE